MGEMAALYCNAFQKRRPHGRPRRLISLIRHWLKGGILEDGKVYSSEEGTPQGGSISVLLSNVYLHDALDLWFERVVKIRLLGQAHLVRYIDDFVICFQYRSDAIRVQDALRLRLGKLATSTRQEIFTSGPWTSSMVSPDFSRA